MGKVTRGQGVVPKTYKKWNDVVVTDISPCQLAHLPTCPLNLPATSQNYRGIINATPYITMKSKILLLALLVSVGSLYANQPPENPPGNPPPKGEKKKHKEPKAPEGVSDEDWKKLLEARKASASDPAVAAAQAALDTAKAGTDEKAIAQAQCNLAEAQKAAVTKANPGLADAADKAAKADKERAGSGKSKSAGSGSGAGSAKPAIAGKQ